MKIPKLTGLAIITILCITCFSSSTISQDIPMIVLSNIELVTVDESTAAVTWVSNLPADTSIQWGETEELGEEISLEEATLYHFVEIPLLETETQYYYRVGSGGRWSEIDSFTTLAPSDDDLIFTFAVVADTHIDVDGQNTPNGFMYGDSVRLLESLIDELNQDDSIDLVMTLGDLTNGAQEEDYSDLVNAMDQLYVNWYPVLGNHDKTSLNWYDYYNTYLARDSTYYSFDHMDYHFVILDSAVQGEVKGDLNSTQLAWLESDLDSNAGKPTLIFLHHINHRTDIMGLDENAKEALDLILSTRSWVLSVYSGHSHQNYITEGDHGQMYITVAATVSYPVGYSIVKVNSKGYSQAFHKIESELELSEESRRRINAASGNPNADEEYLGTIEDRSLVVELPANQPPVISYLTADPGTTRPGGSSTISVAATDPDDDELTYQYDTSGGSIEGSGATVTYIAPQYTGTFTIFVTVSDGEFTSAVKSIDIEVKETIINTRPEIKKIWNSKSTVKPNEDVILKVTAVDSEKDKLTYHYSAEAGEISGTGDEVKWIAPDSVGEYTITIWVSDWELSSEKKIINIKVSEQQSTDSGWIPGFELIAFFSAGLVIIIFEFNKRRR